jgi:DNA-binding response OmpR family regulator
MTGGPGFEAGMDDFPTKPLVPAALNATIARFADGSVASAARRSGSSATTAVGSQALAPGGVNGHLGRADSSLRHSMSPATTTPARHRMLDTLRALRRRKVAAMLALGSSSGLPFMLTGSTLG